MQLFHVKQIWMKKSIEAKEEQAQAPEFMKIVPLPDWEDMLPQGLEMLRHISTKDKKIHPPNPYKYNLKGSSPKPPLGPSPLKPKKGVPDEIEEKITELEQVSKACVSTVGEGIDAY